MSLEKILKSAKSDVYSRIEPSIKGLKMSMKTCLSPHVSMKGKIHEIMYWGAVIYYKFTSYKFTQRTNK